MNKQQACEPFRVQKEGTGGSHPRVVGNGFDITVYSENGLEQFVAFINENRLQEPSEPPVEEEHWATRSGEKVAVGDMSLTHLRGVLRMILRTKRRRLELRRAIQRLGFDLDAMIGEDRMWGDD